MDCWMQLPPLAARSEGARDVQQLATRLNRHLSWREQPGRQLHVAQTRAGFAILPEAPHRACILRATPSPPSAPRPPKRPPR